MNGTPWTSVTSRTKCSVCGKDSWCSITDDGATALCRRESGGATYTKVDKNGVEYYVHRLGKPHVNVSHGKWSKSSEAPRADSDTLHAVYDSLLTLLTLNREHEKLLTHRGLPLPDIEERRYRSQPSSGRYELADALLKKFGEKVCLRVPGLVYRKVLRDKIWSIGFCPGSGILIPSRNWAGQIEALKIRPDKAEPGRKYLYLSSRGCGGPSPGARVHVPLFKGDTDTVRLTEGELKADVSTVLSEMLAVSVPGVQSWSMALPILKKIHPRTVRISFDADAITNIHVARAIKNAVFALETEGFKLEVETWT